MDEKNIEDKEIINAENQQESENNLLNNEINNEINENNNIENLNNNIKEEEVDVDKNNIKENEILTNEEEKEQIIDNINNNEINENINNINNIKINNNLPFQLNFPQNNIKSFDFDKNLSKEQREEQIENNLRKCLTELASIKEQGNNYYNNKNYELAEQKYKEGIQRIEEEFSKMPNLEEPNDQIKEHLININIFHSKFHNNLSTVLFKQKKYEESLKTAEYIIQNINKDHDVSYCRILFCLIELKKIILANHYADIIKKKFRNEESISKFQEQFDRLDKLNKEFSDNLLNNNPELKKEINSINNNIENNINNDINFKKEEEKEEEENENNYTKYLPYIIGGFAFLLIGGRYLYKSFNSK